MRKRIAAAAVAMSVIAGVTGVLPADIAHVTGNAAAAAVDEEPEYNLFILDNITYHVYQDHAVLVDYNSTHELICPPEDIRGVPLTEVAENAFAKNENIGYVYLPESVTLIGKGAFYCCPNLKTVEIAGFRCLIEGEGETICNEETDDGYVFNGVIMCRANADPQRYAELYGYTYRVLPRIVRSMGATYEVHENYAILTEHDGETQVLAIPTEVEGVPVTKIADNVFLGNDNLIEVKMSSKLTNIGQGAFESCSNLRKVSMPGVKVIGALAFAGCSELEDPEMPRHLTAMDGMAFAYCKSITHIELPEETQYIGTDAFMCCPNLKEIVFKNPECAIRGLATTICNDRNKDEKTSTYNGVIRGYIGSEAESYAKKYGYTFEDIGAAGRINTEFTGMVKDIMLFDTPDAFGWVGMVFFDDSKIYGISEKCLDDFKGIEAGDIIRANFDYTGVDYTTNANEMICIQKVNYMRRKTESNSKIEDIPENEWQLSHFDADVEVEFHTPDTPEGCIGVMTLNGRRFFIAEDALKEFSFIDRYGTVCGNGIADNTFVSGDHLNMRIKYTDGKYLGKNGNKKTYDIGVIREISSVDNVSPTYVSGAGEMNEKFIAALEYAEPENNFNVYANIRLSNGRTYEFPDNAMFDMIYGYYAPGMTLALDIDYEISKTTGAYLVTRVNSVDLFERGVSKVDGDANGDFEVTIADAALILQHIGNPDKYPLSNQKLANADFDNVSGVSAMDALKIQEFDAMISEILDK